MTNHNPTPAFISQATFAIGNEDFPGIFTATRWSNVGITIRPLGTLPSSLADLIVYIDHRDLAQINALLRAQVAPPSNPSNPSNPPDCCDCHALATRLTQIDELEHRLEGIDAELGDQTQRLSALESRIQNLATAMHWERVMALQQQLESQAGE